MRCKSDDCLIIFQSNFNPYHFIMVKSDTGYRIRRYSKMKKMYQINIGYKFSFINEFDFIQCTYFIKNNNSVRIVIKK